MVTRDSMKVRIGDQICVKGRIGTVKYIGPVEGKLGQFAGIDFKSDIGKNCGEHNGKKYFEATGKKTGAFIELQKLEEEEARENKITSKDFLTESHSKSLKASVYNLEDVTLMDSTENELVKNSSFQKAKSCENSLMKDQKVNKDISQNTDPNYIPINPSNNTDEEHFLEHIKIENRNNVESIAGLDPEYNIDSQRIVNNDKKYKNEINIGNAHGLSKYKHVLKPESAQKSEFKVQNNVVHSLKMEHPNFEIQINNTDSLDVPHSNSKKAESVAKLDEQAQQTIQNDYRSSNTQLFHNFNILDQKNKYALSHNNITNIHHDYLYKSSKIIDSDKNSASLTQNSEEKNLDNAFLKNILGTPHIKSKSYNTQLFEKENDSIDKHSVFKTEPHSDLTLFKSIPKMLESLPKTSYNTLFFRDTRNLENNSEKSAFFKKVTESGHIIKNIEITQKSRDLQNDLNLNNDYVDFTSYQEKNTQESGNENTLEDSKNYSLDFEFENSKENYGNDYFVCKAENIQDDLKNDGSDLSYLTKKTNEDKNENIQISDTNSNKINMQNNLQQGFISKNHSYSEKIDACNKFEGLKQSKLNSQKPPAILNSKKSYEVLTDIKEKGISKILRSKPHSHINSLNICDNTSKNHLGLTATDNQYEKASIQSDDSEINSNSLFSNDEKGIKKKYDSDNATYRYLNSMRPQKKEDVSLQPLEIELSEPHYSTPQKISTSQIIQKKDLQQFTDQKFDENLFHNQPFKNSPIKYVNNTEKNLKINSKTITNKNIDDLKEKIRNLEISLEKSSKQNNTKDRCIKDLLARKNNLSNQIEKIQKEFTKIRVENNILVAKDQQIRKTSKSVDILIKEIKKKMLFCMEQLAIQQNELLKNYENNKNCSDIKKASDLIIKMIEKFNENKDFTREEKSLEKIYESHHIC